MNKKLAVIILFGFFIYLSFPPSSVWGAIIMTDDGNSMNCLVDGEQFIKIKTSKGESVVNFKDVIWMAGKNNKKIRLSGKSKSMRGEMIAGVIEDKKQIKVQKGAETIFLSPEDIIFFFKGDIDLEKTGHLQLEEYNDTYRLRAGIKKDTEKFRIELLPENWRGNIKISNPIYTKKVTSRSDFKMTFFTEVDDPSLYKDMDFTIVLTLRSHGEESKEGLSVTKYVPLDRGLLLKHNNSVGFSSPFYNPSPLTGYEFFGNGYFTLHIGSISSDDDSKKDELGGGNLFIMKTVSNILELPITIEKNKE